MSKKSQQEKFVPFQHSNLGFKNVLLNYARESKSNEGFEYQLASAFIYISFTEYLARHFIENLNYIISEQSRTSFAGIIYFNKKNETKPKTLGDYIKMLEDYEFPDKVAVLKLFRDINSRRNSIYHNSALNSEKEFINLVKEDITEVESKVEELLERINTVYSGLQKILSNPSSENNGTS